MDARKNFFNVVVAPSTGDSHGSTFFFFPTKSPVFFSANSALYLISRTVSFWWCLVLPCASESNLRFRFFFNKLSRAGGAVVVLQTVFFFVFFCLIAINWWWCPLKVRAKRNNLGASLHDDRLSWDDAKEEIWISLLTWSLEIMICALGENLHEKRFRRRPTGAMQSCLTESFPQKREKNCNESEISHVHMGHLNVTRNNCPRRRTGFRVGD